MSDYTVCSAKSGAKTLIKKSSDSDRDIKLHSAYDPVKEAERSVDAFDRGKCSLIAVSGIALGYHISMLKKKYPEIRILAIENDPSVTELCRIHNPDSLSGVLVIHSGSDLNSFFESINLSDFRGISHYIHRPSYQLNPYFYETKINDIKLYISSRVSDLLTRFEFEEKWIKNIFKNIKWLDSVPGISSFFNKFNGYPGIIVSAGPSLRENLHLLNKFKHSSVIVCVDTAIKVLAKAGIQPHFVMTLDAQKYSFKHFTGVKPGKTVLVSDIVSCPSILNYYDGYKTISTTSKYYQDSEGKTVRETTPVMDWFERYITTPGDIQSGGSVATSAFDLLLNLGCDPIILCGQDLAYPGREYHCSGTYHNDDWLPQISRMKNLDTINQNVIRKRKIKYVTKFGGTGKVISDFVFDLYKSWFEDSAAKVKVRVINSSSGGSRIKNTDEIYAGDIRLSGKQDLNPQDIIDNIFKNYENKNSEKLLKKLVESFKKIKNIIDISELNISEKEKYNKIDELLDDADINSLIKPLMRKSEFYMSRHSLESGRTETMIYNDVVISSRKLLDFISSSGLIDEYL